MKKVSGRRASVAFYGVRCGLPNVLCDAVRAASRACGVAAGLMVLNDNDSDDDDDVDDVYDDDDNCQPAVRAPWMFATRERSSCYEQRNW